MKIPALLLAAAVIACRPASDKPAHTESAGLPTGASTSAAPATAAGPAGAPAASGRAAPIAMARLPIPFSDTGACPFEGCRYRVWNSTQQLYLRVAPSLDSAVAFQIPGSAWVRAVTGVVITTAPGIVRFSDNVTIAAGRDSLHATPADTLFVLHPVGDGFVTAWFKGRLYRAVDATRFFNGSCPRGEKCNGYVAMPPRTEWWAQIRADDGQTGWTNQPETFACKDQLGGDKRCESHQSSAKAQD